MGIELKIWIDPHYDSCILINLVNSYFPKLSAAVVQDLSKHKDKYGVRLVREAIIRCGLGLNFNGLWEEMQLSPELQKIVQKYRDHFNGDPVTT